jgi:hypothetical protein
MAMKERYVTPTTRDYSGAVVWGAGFLIGLLVLMGIVNVAPLAWSFIKGMFG